MDEYIEMKALREAFDNADADVVEEYEDGGSDWGFGRQNILEVINSVPTADVAPVRHGRWVDNHCTECGMMPMGDEMWKHCDFDPPSFEKFMDYCPSCGAKMDLEV